MIHIYLTVLAVMIIASWVLSGAVERSIGGNQGFWLRMNALGALWMAPLVASPFAWMYAGKDIGRTAALLTVSLSVAMVIVGAGRMAVMHNLSRLNRAVARAASPRNR